VAILIEAAQHHIGAGVVPSNCRERYTDSRDSLRAPVMRSRDIVNFEGSSAVGLSSYHKDSDRTRMVARALGVAAGGAIALGVENSAGVRVGAGKRAAWCLPAAEKVWRHALRLACEPWSRFLVFLAVPPRSPPPRAWTSTF
jgi:hypothetical protein